MRSSDRNVSRTIGSIAALFVGWGCVAKDPAASGDALSSHLPGFHEISVQDERFPVGGASNATIELRRIGALTYEVRFRTATGNVVTLDRPGNERINPLVSAHRYRGNVLACINSFEDARGRHPSLECMVLHEDSGEILEQSHIDDAWLVRLSETEPRAIVSPGSLLNIDEKGRITCRQLVLTDDAQLRYDATSAVDCEEVESTSSKGDSSERALGRSASRSRPRRVRGPDLSANTRQIAACYDTDGHWIPCESTVSTPDAPAPGPPPGAPGEGCGPEPESDRRESPPSVWPGAGTPLVLGTMIPDWLVPGWTISYYSRTQGEERRATDLPRCLNLEQHFQKSHYIDLEFGPAVGSGYWEERQSHLDCGNLACTGDQWSCGPSGITMTKSNIVDLTYGLSVPLDWVPVLKPVCGLSWVSCNVDIEGKYGSATTDDESSGDSQCGAQCPIPGQRRKRFETRSSAGSEISGEISFSGTVSRWGKSVQVSGKGGVSGVYEHTRALVDRLECDVRMKSSYACERSSVELYYYLCFGANNVEFCTDFVRKRIYSAHSGDCPPFDAGGRESSAGTQVGAHCAKNSRFWSWDTYKQQCLNCCQSAPLPPGEDESEFNSDCLDECFSMQGVE
jgi:hypothetical protein